MKGPSCISEIWQDWSFKVTDRESIHTEAIAETYVRITYKGKSFVGIQTAMGIGVEGEKYALVQPHYIFMQDEVEAITKKEYFIGKLEGHEFRTTES
jgi:hypothetical protein